MGRAPVVQSLPDTSFKCGIYLEQGRDHKPCSGTCDCGQGHLCACPCHGGQ